MRRRMGRMGGWMLVLPLVVVLVVLFAVPVLDVLALSFTDPEPGLDNYWRLVSSAPLQRILITTLRLSAVTTLFAIVFGYAVAYAALHAGRIRRACILTAVLVTFWVSVLARAFAWMTLLRTEGLVNSSLLWLDVIPEPLPMIRNEFGVLIGMVHYMLPYAILPLMANMRQIDPRLVDVSHTLGASRLQAFLRIYLPLSRPGIYAAALLVFVLSLGFYVVPTLLGGGRVVMIAEYVQLQIFQTVRWGVGSMMATVLLVTVIVILALASRLVNVTRMLGAR